MSGFCWIRLGDGPEGSPASRGVSFLSNHQITWTCDQCSSPSRPFLVFLVESDHDSFPHFLDVADGTNFELGGCGLLSVFFRYDVTRDGFQRLEQGRWRSGSWLAPVG